MTYDHTDANAAINGGEVDSVTRLYNRVRLHPTPDGIPEALGAIGYDENGDHYAQTYPPRGMRCS